MSKRRIDGSESDSSLDSDTDWTMKKGKAKGGKPGKTNRANKKSRQLSSSDESEEDFTKGARGSPEEGEVSSSEHADGSDSDSDDLADEPYEDGLNDDLVGDEADRQRLADMTEKEREEELFRRAERRDMLKSRREIELKLKQARKREERKRRHAESGKSPSKSGKRTESATGSAKQTEKAANSGSRRRALEEKNAEQKRRMQELRAKREERMRKERERKDEELRAAEANEAVSKTRLRTSDVFSDAESDSEDSEKRPGARRSTGSRSRSRSRSDSGSGSEESRRSESSAASSGDEGLDAVARKAARERRKEEKRLKNTDVSSVADLMRARLTRTMLEELVYRENFRELAVGAYVRVGIVTGSSTAGGDKRPTYSIGEIVEVVESLKTYKLGSNFTNRAVKLRHYPHPFRLEYVSNSDFKDDELSAFKRLVERNGEKMPTLFQVESKHRAIRDERTRPLDERGVAHLVAEKKRLAAAAGGAHTNVTNHTVRKHELAREREQAELDGDAARAHQLAEQIARVEEEHTRITRAAAQHLDAVTRINERNRQRNRELEEAMRREYIEMKKAVDDPLARRPCRPQILTVRSAEMLLSGMDEKPQSPPAPAPPAVDVVDAKTLPSNTDVKKVILPDASPSTSGALAVHATPVKQDDLFSMHDFDLNLDDVPNVPLPTNFATVLHRPGASASAGRIKLPGYAASSSKLPTTPTPHIATLSASRDRDSLDTKPDTKPGGILGTNPTVLKRLIGNRLSN